MPHLYELRPLPIEVGGVPIIWFNPEGEKTRERQIARREKSRLLLPSNPQSDFLPLGDRKILFLNWDRSATYSPRYSFCGMDQSPFHVFVREEAVEAYKKGGPDEFFESLVPPLIKKLRERPDISDPDVRQGDWFANKLSFSWEEIEQFMRLGRGQKFGTEEVKKESLGGTRHHFTGRIAREVPIFGYECTLLEGIISAPDHSPLVLSGGPHAIAQAANLADPRNAD